MKVTTFFSYKGGAGRSTTCYNTIPFLVQETGACRERPILLIDMDIESAGMTYLLNKDKDFKGKFDVKTLLKNELQFSINRCDIFKHPIYERLIPVGNDMGVDDDYAVMFLGVDDSSSQLNRSEITGDVSQVFNKLADFADNNLFSAIVMDSAAGDQFSANIAIGASNKVVFCMKMTHQFRIGTFNYLDKFATLKPQLAKDVDIILLPTVVPNDAEIDGKSQLQTSIDDIAERLAILRERKPFMHVIDDYVTNLNHFGINEVVRFKWQEGILYKIKKNVALKEDEEKALYQYEALARTIGE